MCEPLQELIFFPENMLTHVLLVLMIIQQAVSSKIPIDDCIPTGETKRGLIDPCEGNPEPAINTKCCSPKDKSHCVSTLMWCDNMGVCTCKPKEETEDCIPTGETKEGVVDDMDGNYIMKCCSSKAEMTCTHTRMMGNNGGSCTCK